MEKPGVCSNALWLLLAPFVLAKIGLDLARRPEHLDRDLASPMEVEGVVINNSSSPLQSQRTSAVPREPRGDPASLPRLSLVCWTQNGPM